MYEHQRRPYPYSKMVATCFGLALCGVETWLNAEHVALSEGWFSSMVAATVAASLSAAAALPFAERAWVGEQKTKATCFFVFFILMAGFSFSTSSGRLESRYETGVVSAKSNNARIDILKAKLEAARQTVNIECGNPGPKCQGARNIIQDTLDDLARAPVKVETHHAAAKLSSSPLLLPLAMQLGGFVFVAFGLAPRAKEPPLPEIKSPIEEAEPKKPMTEKQALAWVLQRIRASSDKKSPPIRELASELGMPSATLSTWMRRWVDQGALSRDGRKYALPKRAKLKLVS